MLPQGWNPSNGSGALYDQYGDENDMFENSQNDENPNENEIASWSREIANANSGTFQRFSHGYHVGSSQATAFGAETRNMSRLPGGYFSIKQPPQYEGNSTFFAYEKEAYEWTDVTDLTDRWTNSLSCFIEMYRAHLRIGEF